MLNQSELVQENSSQIDAFTNRLRKNLRHLQKWAKREQVSCYRLYDKDIPEFPFAIDLYANQVHLQEYARRDIEPIHEIALREAVADATQQVLNVPSEALHWKTRERQRGLSQYEKNDEKGAAADFVVTEGGLKFWVNLSDYLDTGLFLDHRPMREWIKKHAAGQRVLNLFAYTGSFTVYAAAGGAASSLTVDLSNTYQAWAERNFILNGMNTRQHQLMRADALTFLRQAVARKQSFDLIILDPPSFSNSAKMLGILDVQRDHSEMIRQCMQLLSERGVLLFSNNLRSFKLDGVLAQEYQCEDVTARSIPLDFRNHKIHHCWLIRHR